MGSIFPFWRTYKVRCRDGSVKTVYRDVNDAFPLFISGSDGKVIASADVLKKVKGVHGFYGASSMERLPTEIAIKEQMEKFKAVRFK